MRSSVGICLFVSGCVPAAASGPRISPSDLAPVSAVSSPPAGLSNLSQLRAERESSSGFGHAEPSGLGHAEQQSADDSGAEGKAATDVSQASAHENSLKNQRGGHVERDYALRVGIGFSAEELQVLEQAAASWALSTGLPLHLRPGYGPLGNFHIAESIPVCGQSWVYDGYLGCYSPAFDNVVINRHGVELHAAQEDSLLFVVFVHEIGHWLGLEHAEEGEDSVMVADYPTLAVRSGELSAVSPRDVRAACRLNPCRL